MIAQPAALLYATTALMPITMHLALVVGAPLGRFTMGGVFAGRLPAWGRALALAQAALLAGMALAVLDRGGVLGLDLPAPAFRLTFVLTLLTTIANAASPSRPERRLWTPVTLLMTAAATGVALP